MTEKNTQEKMNRAVLVECGFLSNGEETVLLQQPDYQLTLAAAITAGCMAWNGE